MSHLKRQTRATLIAEPAFGNFAGVEVFGRSVGPGYGAAGEVACEGLVGGAGGFAAGCAEAVAHPLWESGAGVADFGAGAAALEEDGGCHFDKL